MINVSILGSGKSAENFIKSIKNIPNFKIDEIGCRNKLKAKKLIEKFNLNTKVNTIEKIINSKKTQLVIICLPSYVQLKVLKKLFEQKKDVICEKPFTLNFKEAETAFQKWKKNKTICLVNFCYNYLDAFKYVVKEIKINKLDINTINVSWQTFKKKKNLKSHWKINRNTGGGMLYNYGSHLLNLFFPNKTKLNILSSHQFFFKKKALNMLSFKNKQSDEITFFSIKNKFIYNFFLSNNSNPSSGLKIELIGSKGTKIISNNLNHSHNNFILSHYYFKDKIIKSKIKKFEKKKISLNDLYFQTLTSYKNIKKKRIAKYKNNIYEGVWNSFLLEELTNFKK